MIEYRMMDENCLLTSCLHGGVISLSASSEDAWAEREYGLPEGSIARFLRALCREYGSCGVMAIDGDSIVAKIRFCPQFFSDTVSPESLCVQTEKEARFIASFDVERLTPKDELPSKTLWILCFQVVSSYRGRGIATHMLETLIEWAKANGWDQIQSKAIWYIRPLLDWTGMWSVERYRKLGFQVIGHTPCEELMQAVIAMKDGCHGDDVRLQWEQYGHLSNDKASWLYDVALNVRPDA